MSGKVVGYSHGARAVVRPRRALCRAAAAGSAMLFGLAAAHAQAPNSVVASGFSAADFFARFQQAFADQDSAADGQANRGASARNGPAASPELKYRVWAEGYGMHIKNAERDGVAADTRRTFGGAGGVRVIVAPGISLGFSVDQNHTNVDAPDVLEQAKFDLTQLSINAAIESGPWTVSLAALRGFADISTSRGSPAGPTTAAYNAYQWGAISELSYYWTQNDVRVVPKIGADWVRTDSDAYAEVGGLDPISAPNSVVNRARVYAGAEIGKSFYGDTTIFDLSGYARVVDTVLLSASSTQIVFLNGLSPPQLLPGPNEARLGFDTGATAWLLITQNFRVYAAYDGRFRDGFQSHSGSFGVDLRW